MRKRKGRAALISMAIAAALVFVLLAAGALLRMNSRGMDFGSALSSFLADTFNPYGK